MNASVFLTLNTPSPPLSVAQFSQLIQSRQSSLKQTHLNNFVNVTNVQDENRQTFDKLTSQLCGIFIVFY